MTPVASQIKSLKVKIGASHLYMLDFIEKVRNDSQVAKIKENDNCL